MVTLATLGLWNFGYFLFSFVCIHFAFHRFSTTNTHYFNHWGGGNFVSLNKIIKDVGRMGVMEEGAHSRGTGDLSGE